MNLTCVLDLIGAPYTWWTNGEWENRPPFYVDKNNKKEVFFNGINCAGLVNVFFKANNKKIPIIPFYPGGTYAYFKVNKHIFNKNPSLEWLLPGTILLNKYKNKNEQGHLAIYIGNNEIVEALPEKGVCISKLYSFQYFAYFDNFEPLS